MSDIQYRTTMIEGEEVFYDVCSANKDSYNEDIFDYIGQGEIHSINGKVQPTLTIDWYVSQFGESSRQEGLHEIEKSKKLYFFRRKYHESI